MIGEVEEIIRDVMIHGQDQDDIQNAADEIEDFYDKVVAKKDGIISLLRATLAKQMGFNAEQEIAISGLHDEMEQIRIELLTVQEELADANEMLGGIH